MVWVNIYLVRIVNKDILDKGITHLHNDVDIHSLILKYEKPKFKAPDRPFIALSKSIIYQQLSGVSARAIHSRFLNLVSISAISFKKNATFLFGYA